jgi:peptidoglycan/xylan/chitin deacetylase (PgdA/CDA1 family)
MERLALTFDDGPDPRGTPAVLAALAAAGAHATAELIGPLVRSARDRGLEPGPLTAGWPVGPGEPGGPD